MCDHPLECAQFTQSHTLRETDSPPPRIRSPMALGQVLEIVPSSPLHDGIEFGLSLYQSCACVTTAVSSNVQVPIVPRTGFLYLSTTCGSYTRPTPSSSVLSGPWVGVV